MIHQNIEDGSMSVTRFSNKDGVNVAVGYDKSDHSYFLQVGYSRVILSEKEIVDLSGVIKNVVKYKDEKPRNN